MAPKGRYGFRVITQIDPLDFLLYGALINEIAKDLEQKREQVEGDQNVVFSYRLAIGSDGQLFDPSIGYLQFLHRMDDLLKDRLITHVVSTDIADFYSRIYHHHLENALANATRKSNHVKAIMHLLSGWNGTQTFGIPVGNAPSRALAEILLVDVDEALLANSINFVRFNDDYRMFASSHAEAYRHLAFLADYLNKIRGLSLQAQKTLILSKKDFRNRFLATPIDREIDSLREKFEQIIKELGLSNPYEEIEYDDFDTDKQKLVDSLNLVPR